MLPASTRAVLDAASTPTAIASFAGEVLFVNVAFRIATNLEPPEHVRELFDDPDDFDPVWQTARSTRRTRIPQAQCRASIALRAPVVTRFRASEDAPWQFMVELADAESAAASLSDLHDRLYDQLQQQREGIVLERMSGHG